MIDALRIPVVAAPMFLVTGPALVIAACRAGIVGAFPTTNCRSAEELDRWMAEITGAIAGRPWAANLITHSTNSRLADDLTLIAKYRPPLVITALGSPAPVLDTVHGYGGQVIADVTTPQLARKALAAGADGLACISHGAGGHTGQLSPFAFISAVRMFHRGLLAVGGGISDGAGVAGAIAAGADLAYMGTRFIASTESDAQEAYKAMLVDASIGEIVVSAAPTGTPASWLRASLAAAGYDDGDTHTQRNYDPARVDAKRWRDIWAAGQGVHATRAVEDVEMIVETLAAEYETARSRLIGDRSN